MPRRPATVLQADVARVIRAARQAGARSVEIAIGGAVAVIRLDEAPPPPLAPRAGDTVDDAPLPVL